MPSRRQIREAAVQFLYCAELEGGAEPAELREAFWDFVTESDRRGLHLATFKTLDHLSQGREGRLEEFVARQASAIEFLAGRPEAEDIRRDLERVAIMESKWSSALAQLQRLPRDDDDATAVRRFGSALAAFFDNDRALAEARGRFLSDIDDFPRLRGPLEAVAASIRRLQRISDRVRMVEEPENFPDQADLEKLRHSKQRLCKLRQQTDRLVDAVLESKETIDRTLASVVEHYSPGRLDPVDRAILRLGTHEILNTDTPDKVVINEAIELAKRFGTSDSGRFVNGILDRVARDKDSRQPANRS